MVEGRQTWKQITRGGIGKLPSNTHANQVIKLYGMESGRLNRLKAEARAEKQDRRDRAEKDK